MYQSIKHQAMTFLSVCWADSLTHPMEQSLSLEACSHSANQEIAYF
jgi:hypothetical protein